MIDDFLLRAMAGGVGVALAAGPLGSFVVWRRMAYYGDSLAHSALLGVALGFLLGLDLTLGIVATCVTLALLLVLLQGQRRLPTDTLLGILAHSALSFGLVAVAFLETVRVDLVGYLFGDILAIDGADLAWIYGGGAAALASLAGCLAVALGLAGSLRFDTPAGPSIVVAATALFAVVLALGALRRRRPSAS